MWLFLYLFYEKIFSIPSKTHLGEIRFLEGCVIIARKTQISLSSVYENG